MKIINIGIIGYGFMGHEHMNMLTSLPGYKVVAVCDIDISQLKDIKSGIKIYKTADSLLKNKDVKVVIISANNNQHLLLVEKAAKAHKDIICEKPAALSVKDFDKMVEITKKNKVKFTIHHQRRFDPDFRTIKAIYDSKTLGNVYTIKNQLYGFNGNMHDWHVYKNQGGGMLYDWGVHLLDQILWMINSKVISVFATVRNVINFEVDDFFNIQLKFANGIQVEVELGTYYLRDDSEHWFERHWFISGNKGSAYVDGFNPSGKICRTDGLLKNVSGHRTFTAAGPTRSFGNPPPGKIISEPLPKVNTRHEHYFINYYNAYFGNGEFIIKLKEVRRVLKLLDAIRKSAKTNKSIDFE